MLEELLENKEIKFNIIFFIYCKLDEWLILLIWEELLISWNVE